ncbi:MULTISPECIES: DUF599 domain-containing protein [Kordiimonas]|uniref:DUF599 domain-containing protein n=1 Tax=Kordiimonas TaxID=288021 RepID=UPI001FF46025|nr:MULTISPECIES: DUF599 domain-containing protein [Kordiimonas]MCK0068124.1 DUF599 domain-containing protein [Kordiimonas laminariae]UTW59905.1 DUF599 domain-containing protein [Kordiimonas sp. SCSIO 12603]
MTFTTFTESLNFSDMDMMALLFFLLLWALYTFLADHSKYKTRAISHLMDGQRLRWLTEAANREMRMIDTGVLKILVTGISFFASSTILVLGGLIAAMGYSEQLAVAFAHIPLAKPLTADGFVVRVGLLVGIFIYAFFKFAWAFRIANYCAIVIGGMSDSRYDEDKAARMKRASVAAKLSSASGHHFNRGIRAYFFALAGLTWFVGPLVFMSATLAVVFVLTRREFTSRAVKLVREL